MHCKRAYAKRLHCIGSALRTKSILYENNRPLTVFQKRSEVLILRLELGLNHNVTRSFCGLELVVTLDPTDVMDDRIVHVLAHEVIDITVKRGREKENLAWTGDVVEQLTYLGGESHVGHAVRFVDDDHCDLVKAGLAAVNEIEQTARRRNRNVHTALEIGNLSSHSGSTKECRHPTLRNTGVRHQHFSHLLGQLSGWNQDQRLRSTGVRSLYSTQHRQAVGECLTRTGRRPATDVFPGERVGQRCALHGERLSNAGAYQRVEKRHRNTEGAKRLGMTRRINRCEFGLSVFAALCWPFAIVLVTISRAIATRIRIVRTTTTVSTRRARTLVGVWGHDAFSVRCGSMAGWKKLASLNTRTTEGSHNRAQPGASMLAADDSTFFRTRREKSHKSVNCSKRSNTMVLKAPTV